MPHQLLGMPQFPTPQFQPPVSGCASQQPQLPEAAAILQQPTGGACQQQLNASARQQLFTAGSTPWSTPTSLSEIPSPRLAPSPLPSASSHLPSSRASHMPSPLTSPRMVAASAGQTDMCTGGASTSLPPPAHAHGVATMMYGAAEGSLALSQSRQNEHFDCKSSNYKPGCTFELHRASPYTAPPYTAPPVAVSFEARPQPAATAYPNLMHYASTSRFGVPPDDESSDLTRRFSVPEDNIPSFSQQLSLLDDDGTGELAEGLAAVCKSPPRVHPSNTLCDEKLLIKF